MPQASLALPDHQARQPASLTAAGKAGVSIAGLPLPSYQLQTPQHLRPVQPIDHSQAFNQFHADRLRLAGLVAWHTGVTPLTCTIHHQQWSPVSPIETTTPSNRLTIEPWTDTLQTGTAWELHLSPDGTPVDPYNDQAWLIEATFTPVTASDANDASADPSAITINAQPETRVATWIEPQLLVDGGDREILRPAGPGRFVCRWRPTHPGTYQLNVRLHQHGTIQWEQHLGSITVHGPPSYEIIQASTTDPRFFAKNDGTFFWPRGLNVRSVWDVRTAARLKTRVTPPRTLAAYTAYIKRLAAQRVNLIEVWCASWNLALEWRDDWHGFGGVGQYHQGHAWQLDHILQTAWEHDMRVLLVVRNHGQGSTRTNTEWANNPYNKLLQDKSGIAFPRKNGLVNDVKDFFTDPKALAQQNQLHRYLARRFGDHPGLFGWKLWSEVDLTSGRRSDWPAWHSQAAQMFLDHDPHQRMATTHWSGTWKKVNPSLARLKEIGFLCIDAYHKTNKPHIGQLFASGMDIHEGKHPRQWNKPILITEYGGSHLAAPHPQLLAEHQSGPWLTMVNGYAASPMLWWVEWVDQNAEWGSYASIAAFLDGEDLRAREDSPSDVLTFEAQGSDGALWCQAWTRPGRMLGYIANRRWMTFD